MKVSDWNVSTFDPHAKVTEEDLRTWLEQRYRLPDDEDVNSYIIWLPSATVTVGIGLPLLIEAIARAPLSMRIARTYRTRRGSIGLFRCDLTSLLNRCTFLILVLKAVLVATAWVAGSHISDSALWGGLTSIAAWSMMGWRGQFAFPVYGAVVVLAAVDQHLLLWLLLPGIFVFRAVRIALMAWEAGVLSPTILDSPVLFLGHHYVIKAFWNKTAASVLLAVDKATHDDRARTVIFTRDAMADAPAYLKPVLVQCDALAALAEPDLQSAMRLSQEARALCDEDRPEIRGWCALQSGDVLLAAGQLAAAEVRWKEAEEDLLKAGSRARYWLAETRLRRIEALTRDLDSPTQCLEGLRILYELRLSAVRRADLALLEKTENLLLRLMREAENSAGALEHLEERHRLAEGRMALKVSVGDSARLALLLATLCVDALENPEDYPAKTHGDIRLRQERYAFAASVCDDALRHLSTTADRVAEALALALLARIQTAVDLREEALANALHSLNVVHQVRYQLPTTAWRTSWTTGNAETYALALDLASGQDSSLVAELLEVVRAQAVPLEADSASNLLRSVFDSLVSQTGLPISEQRSDTDLNADPVIPDQTILVQQASWVGGNIESAIDLDTELQAMYPNSWYWSYCRVGQSVYHAVRSPDGDWVDERRDYGELADPLHVFVRHLPINLQSETNYESRDSYGAIRAEYPDKPTDRGTAGQVWSRILNDLGGALIPWVLAQRIDTADAADPISLVAAPTGALVLVPVSALVTGAGRDVVDYAYTTYVPSIALLAARRRLLTCVDSGGDASKVLAVLAPHVVPGDSTAKDGLPQAETTVPDSSAVLFGYLTRDYFADRLRGERSEEGTLFLAGHVLELDDVSAPGRTGIQFSDGPLNLREFYRVRPDGTPHYRMPGRVVLAGCMSLGVYPDIMDDSIEDPDSTLLAPEWLGMGAAVIYAGAQHVFCTLYPVLDTEHTKRIDLALVDAMREGSDPARALRDVQRAEIQRWRNSKGTLLVVANAYAYVGIGDNVTDPTQPQILLAPAPLTPRSPNTEQSIAAIGPKPRTFHPVFEMLRSHPAGSTGGDGILEPSLVDGVVQFTDFDGTPHGPIEVHKVTWSGENVNTLVYVQEKSRQCVRRLHLYITDCRIVLISSDPRARKVAVGHIRYPWISALLFRPTHSLYDSRIQLHMRQGIDDTTDRFWELRIEFPKHIDSAEITHHILRRLADHHLRLGELPVEAIAGFESLRNGTRQPYMDTGEFAAYQIGYFKRYPDGIDYLYGKSPRSGWLGPQSVDPGEYKDDHS
ncbi:CHAT domain-containing protein [Nocardia sp. NPDC058705]|uniref:CHAT domain-containing protein n=1 Tax=Nocardia sp. NPDC058705 TaxID=3346609 RepID=UPI00369CBBDB